MPAAKTPEEIDNRNQLCLEMRVKGATFREIAMAHDLSTKGAMDAVNRALDEAKDAGGRKDIERLRDMELMRLQKMTAKLWGDVECEDGISRKERNEAIKLLLNISKRHSELCGLDAPIDADSTKLTDEQLRAELMRRLATITPLPGGDGAPRLDASGGNPRLAAADLGDDTWLLATGPGEDGGESVVSARSD